MDLLNPRALWGLMLVLVAATGLPRAAGAQLIAPGKLSRAHADLEGVTRCTLCHELRHKGISPPLCLACHTPLAARIQAGKGFHASLTEKDCAACHREHFGSDFDLVRLDTASFDHTRTGWRLEGRHNQTSCRECHKQQFVQDSAVRRFAGAHGALDRTFLGLSTECASCHQTDSPHGSQFRGQTCGTCHTAEGWKKATLFDHDRTSFALTGAHERVACGRCHTSVPGAAGRPPVVRYEGVSSGCASCHEADSPHGAQFQGRQCGECHDTNRWTTAPRFDHDRARFPLTGKHHDVACSKCHAPVKGAGTARTVRYRGLAFASCASCHADPHKGSMKKPCAACHSTAGWSVLDPGTLKESFDHATTGFALKGRHAAVACADCHDAKTAARLSGVHMRFVAGTETHTFPRPEAGTCGACHVDAHGGVFAGRSDGGRCDACHREDAWAPATFDATRHNTETHFALEGAHLAVPCASCHTTDAAGSPKFDLGAVTCRSCHDAADPHGGQFAGRSCAECHSVSSFRIEAFDHTKTRFPLVGAHRTAACSACHHTERTAGGKRMVRYRPLGTECRDCHGGGK